MAEVVGPKAHESPPVLDYITPSHERRPNTPAWIGFWCAMAQPLFLFFGMYEVSLMILLLPFGPLALGFGCVGWRHAARNDGVGRDVAWVAIVLGGLGLVIVTGAALLPKL